MPNQIDMRPELFGRHITHNPLRRNTIDPRKWVKTPFEMTQEILFGAVTNLLEDISAATGIDLLGFRDVLGGDLVQWVQNFNAFSGVDFSGDPASWDIDAARQAFFTTVIEPLQQAVQGIINSVLPGWLPQVPLASITNIVPNLLWNGGFDDPVSINPLSDFVHDATFGMPGTNPIGSARITFDGTDKQPLWGNAVPAIEGDSMTFTTNAFWDSVAVSGGNSLEMYAGAFRADDTLIEEVFVAGVNAVGTAADWTQLSGIYTAPAETAYVAMDLRGRQYATAGTGWLDNSFITKAPAFQIDWVKDLSGKVQNLDLFGKISGAFVQTAESDVNTMFSVHFQNMIARFFGLPDSSDVTDPTKVFADASMGNIWSEILENTNAIRGLQVQPPAGGVSVSIDFSDYADGPLPSGEFEVTYSGTGTSTIVVNNGESGWATVNDADRVARIRYLPTKPSTDFIVLRATLGDVPQQGNGGSDNPKIWGCARATSDWQNFVFARGYCTGFLTYRGDLGCYVSGVEYIFAANISLSWNTNITIYLGVQGNPRRYQVYSGSKLVKDYTEPTNVSLLPSAQGTPANYRFFGLITEMEKGNSARTPGTMAGFSMSDV